ncbi:DUF2272 domain-containing protein [Segetibacter sp. 3557_3]|uniref:DUF2272 domain-containing protein n=1 Tax=Segetibacter sp. 3557_3 TaxID=2547429 RepID=UPI0010583EFE|nr:DUF2272 domain-containing protein [Segetibacter sp. 3557_3]TDH23984.1 DUF2272 domain-containing protein [Segetibacter sp. 3557_3]
MASLQRSFQYQGSIDWLPFNEIILEVHFPQYAHTIVREVLTHVNEVVKREPAGIKQLSAVQLLGQSEYHVPVPFSLLHDESPDLLYPFLIYHKVERLRAQNLTNFISTVKYLYKDEYNNELGQQQFDVIYGLKATGWLNMKSIRDNLSQVTQQLMSLNNVNLQEVQRALESEKNKLFLINKSAYDQLLEQIRRLAEGDNNDLYLLHIIEGTVNLSARQPRLTKMDSYLQRWVYSILSESGIANEKQKEVLELIKDNFNSLFDFPISVPEIKTIEIEGTFVVISDSTISENDLGFYDLVIEYTQKNGLPKIIRYDWATNDSSLTDNSINFSFLDSQPVVVNSIANHVSVKVKGFDGSLLWHRVYNATDPILQALEIEVQAYGPNVMSGIPATPTRGKQGKRLRGKVIQLGNKYDLNELTIVVQAQKEVSGSWRIVGAAQTDKSGNFSLDYPYGIYTAAQALVSLMPNSPADLEIDANSTTNESISNDFIYLLLQDDQVVEPEQEEDRFKEEECDCEKPTKAKRLPDQADLIASDEYTQDIGGTCLNLSTPNRTLREYSYNAIVRISDPDVANYVLKKNAQGDNITYTLEGGQQKLERRIVDLDNRIYWEDAPDAKSNLSFYQAVTVATGHILYYKSVFKADGYSLGDLVYSLPLAPGQKKQIVVFESSHSLQGAETQSLTQGERLSAELLNERIITDQISGGISEDISGRSSASTAGVSAGLGVGVSYGGIGGSLGVAGGYSNSKSSASQNSERNISQFFGEKLRQSIMQNAESFRALNASVVTTVTEGQNYGVTSEVVANHNHCHSLTMMYFEVLRHYAIFQELSHVEECVFVPLLLTHFTTENIHKWKDVLAQHLLPVHSSTYLQPFQQVFKGRSHPLLKAFDANERIKTDWTRVDFPAENETYADGMITQIRGSFDMEVNIQRPKTRYDRIKSLPIITQTITREELDVEGTIKKNVTAALAGPFAPFLIGSETRTVQQQVQVAGQIFDQFMTLDANYASVPPSKCIRVINFHSPSIPLPFGLGTFNPAGEEFFDGGHMDRQLWEAYAKILDYTDANGVFDMLTYYFSGRLIAEWDEIFFNDILPLVFAKLVDSISIHWDRVRTETISGVETLVHSGDGFSLDFSTNLRYTGGNKKITVNFSSQGEVGKKRSALPLYISVSSSNSDAIAIKNHIRLNIGRVSIDYDTANFHGSLFRGYVNDDLLDGTNLYIPLNARDKTNPRKEDRYIVSQLIEHLNSNLEHYNKVLWYRLDPDRRFMLLDGFHIQLYNSFGLPAGYKSLASVVKNELITITGNSMVFPVAGGYKVSRSYIIEESDEGLQEISLMDYYKPPTPTPPYRISVPTRGVFMEAIQGSCDACEMVKENSSQDWDKFRTEEPTPISPVVTPTPTITEYKPQYKDFAPPMVNIQNAPETPAPAAGLSQLAELLGKSEAFRDITGLQGNQRNVMETYLSNQANAKAFAEMAKSLATQQHNTTNSEDLSRRMQEARQRDAISEEDYQDLTRQHLQQQIDGGESLRERARTERESSQPSLMPTAAEAASQGQTVHAERTTADGTNESVSISGDTTEGQTRRRWMDGVPADMVAFKSNIARVASSEYNFWHTGGPHPGEAYWETDSHVQPRLIDYWMSAYAVNATNGVVPSNPLTREQALAKIAAREAWSAAFICYIIRTNGITNNDVFLRSIRHVNFIRNAKLSRDTRAFNNPFWAVRINEYAPQLGDIVCRSNNSSGITYDTIGRVHSGHSHTDIITEVNQSENYIIVIGGNLEYEEIWAQWDSSQNRWINRFNRPDSVRINRVTQRFNTGEEIPYGVDRENVSVGKRKIYLTQDGKIDLSKNWEVFNNVQSDNPNQRVQFVGPQTEYFAIIKIRTNQQVE